MRELGQWQSVNELWALYLGSYCEGFWYVPGSLRSLCTPCRWSGQRTWPQSWPHRCSRSPQTHFLCQSSLRRYRQCCKTYITQWKWERSSHHVRCDLRVESVLTEMALRMHCDKEQGKKEWFAAWQEQSVDACINRLDSFSQDECFTRDSDAISPPDSQNRERWDPNVFCEKQTSLGHKRKKNERKFPHKQILGCSFFCLFQRNRNKTENKIITWSVSWGYVEIKCEQTT